MGLQNFVRKVASTVLVLSLLLTSVATASASSSDSLTRAMFAKMLVEGMGADISDSGTDCFLDVVDHWGANYICYLVDQGIFNGYVDGTFHPDDTLNRAEAAMAIVSAYGLAILDDEQVFADVTGDEWYYSSVTTLGALGVPSTKYKFYPGYNLSVGRAQLWFDNLPDLETSEAPSRNSEAPSRN